MPTLRALLLACLACTCAAATPAPEFGASISYAKGDPAFTVAGLRGKVALVVFFQSWCGICNGWSPELIKQLEAAYGDDRRVLLVGIKTDGDAADAKEYLASHGGTPERWLVAADAEGAYATRVMGAVELWQYAVIAPDGTIAGSGKAGMFYERGGKKAFSLAVAKLGDKHGQEAKPRLAGEYPPALARAVRLAEAGCFADAIVAAQATPAKAEATALRDEILAWAATTVAAQSAAVADAAAPVADRYAAARALRDLAAQLKGSEPAKAAAKALAEAQRDKALKREFDAERAWNEMQARLAKVPADKRKQALAQAVPQFVKAYEGTVHAGIAQAAVE